MRTLEPSQSENFLNHYRFEINEDFDLPAGAGLFTAFLSEKQTQSQTSEHHSSTNQNSGNFPSSLYVFIVSPPPLFLFLYIILLISVAQNLSTQTGKLVSAQCEVREGKFRSSLPRTQETENTSSKFVTCFLRSWGSRRRHSLDL